MSKLFSMYNELKKKDKNIVYLFKSGIFYIALDSDAILLSNKLNLKLTQLNESIVKCGFPTSSIEKYIKILSTNNINYKIIDSEKNIEFSPESFIANRDIHNLLDFIVSTDVENLSISEAFDFLSKLKIESKRIKEIL